VLNNFTVQDYDGNEASLDGSVVFENFAEPVFDIRLRSAGFRFLNTTSDDNDLFYGTIIAGINADVTGTAASPRWILKLNWAKNQTYIL
jgi:translocation and assembly module TamB